MQPDSERKVIVPISGIDPRTAAEILAHSEKGRNLGLTGKAAKLLVDVYVAQGRLKLEL